jgi:uncharacterized protein YbjQ (UPF0145 family)
MSSIQTIQERTGVHLLTCQVPAGMRMVACFGIVDGRAIYGANFIKDFFARVSDVTGGRVGGYETALKAAVHSALEQMAADAAKLGANAIVSIDIDTSTVGSRMLMATCYGTAVRLVETPVVEPIDEPTAAAAPASLPAAPMGSFEERPGNHAQRNSGRRFLHNERLG